MRITSSSGWRVFSLRDRSSPEAPSRFLSTSATSMGSRPAISSASSGPLATSTSRSGSTSSRRSTSRTIGSSSTMSSVDIFILSLRKTEQARCCRAVAGRDEELLAGREGKGLAIEESGRTRAQAGTADARAPGGPLGGVAAGGAREVAPVDRRGGLGAVDLDARGVVESDVQVRCGGGEERNPLVPRVVELAQVRIELGIGGDELPVARRALAVGAGVAHPELRSRGCVARREKAAVPDRHRREGLVGGE